MVKLKTLCDCLLILMSIFAAWFLHQSCNGNHILKDKDWIGVYSCLCLVKAVGGIIVRLIECWHMNKNPHDKHAGMASDFWTNLLTDLPLLVLSLWMIDRPQMCQGHKAIDFSDVLTAFHINGWVSLIQSVYHLVKSCKKNWYFATVHAILAGFVILRSNCIL